jgi:hypothetical protein
LIPALSAADAPSLILIAALIALTPMPGVLPKAVLVEPVEPTELVP